jgi:hypothetical protein
MTYWYLIYFAWDKCFVVVVTRFMPFLHYIANSLTLWALSHVYLEVSVGEKLAKSLHWKVDCFSVFFFLLLFFSSLLLLCIGYNQSVDFYPCCLFLELPWNVYSLFKFFSPTNNTYYAFWLLKFRQFWIKFPYNKISATYLGLWFFFWKI